MLTKPILNEISTFDATEQKRFDFQVIGGNQVFGNNLVIERVSDNAQMYNETVETYNLRHTMLADSLYNGFDYKAKIRTKDINGNWSEFSDYVIFWCFSKPIINVTSIDYENQNRVYNQNVLFTAEYSQSEGELLQSYRYLLYDSNGDLLNTYPEQFPDDETSLTQEITDLENNTLYYIEVITLSPNGNEGSSDKINFKPLYVSPRIVASIDPIALPEEGAIKVQSSIIQILFSLYDKSDNLIAPSSVNYIDDEWIDMSDYGKLVADYGFDIFQSDFMLQLHCKNLPENKIILQLSSPDGYIRMYQLNNRIRVDKVVNGVGFKTYFASNEFTATATDELSVYMRQVNGLIDLKVEILV